MSCNIEDTPSSSEAIAVIISSCFCLSSICMTLFASAFFLFFRICSILLSTGSSGSANIRSNSFDSSSSVSESEEEEYANLFHGVCRDDCGGGGGSDFLKSVRTTQTPNKSRRISLGSYTSPSFSFLCRLLGTRGQTFRS